MYTNLIYLSNGYVTDHQERVCLDDYELIGRLSGGVIRRVCLAKKRLTEDRFALKIVLKPFVSKVEKEVLNQAAGSRFLMHLITYFETTVSCGFKQSVSMH